MKKTPFNIAFFGSSLLSSYWNGAATYYRGIIKSLNKRGHHITFYEPDAWDRQKNRDIAMPDWAEVKVYDATEEAVERMFEQAAKADIVIKASGVGVLDEYLEKNTLKFREKGKLVIFWDVDAPATLERVHEHKKDPFLKLIPEYDLIFTYGGGQPVVDAYQQLGAKQCIPIFNGLDPETHYPVSPVSDFQCDLAFLGNRLPDREDRVVQFFLHAARDLNNKKFILGGSGWGDRILPQNINYTGHVYTKDHNAFNSTPKAVLNISRQSMADYGFSPATRVFEAAGAGACIITDDWEGIEHFFEPGKEILVAKNTADVIHYMKNLTPELSEKIGAAARKRALREHTYDLRAELVEISLNNALSRVDYITNY